jgi:hypothetical protein
MNLALGLLAAAFVHTEPVTPPGLQVQLSGTQLQVTGSARPGPLRLTLSGDRTVNFSVLAGDRRVAGAAVGLGRPYRTTIPADAREYVVAADGLRTTFTPSGAPSEVPAPYADARVTITDDAIEVPAALPRSGVIRVDQRATHTRGALAFRLPRALATDEAIALVRKGRVGRVGVRTDLVGPVSPGTTNRVRTTLLRGRYLVVSLARHPLIAATKVG